MAHSPTEVGTLLISVFPNCLGEHFTGTKLDFRQWKTPEGIALGGTERDIINAYGPPVGRYKMEEGGYTGLIFGSTDGYGHTLALPSEIRPWVLGSEELVYGGGEDDLRSASFGLREGRVVWIYLSDNE